MECSLNIVNQQFIQKHRGGESTKILNWENNRYKKDYTMIGIKSMIREPSSK